MMRLRLAADLLEMCFDSGLVKLIRFAFFYSDGIERAIAEAGAEAVTEVVGNQAGFAVDNLDGAFGTGRDTESAAVAFLFIDLDHFANHIGFLLSRYRLDVILLLPAVYTFVGLLTLTGVKRLEKIVPEQIQPAAPDQVLAGETHDLADFFTMPGLEAVDLTVFAGRFLFQRTP